MSIRTSNLPEFSDRLSERERKILEIWEGIERTNGGSRPLWPSDLLEIAKHVACGATEMSVPQKPGERPLTYAGRIRRLQSRFPVICFVPSDEDAYGIGSKGLRKIDAIPGEMGEIVIHPLTEAQVNAMSAAQAILEKAGLEASGGPTFSTVAARSNRWTGCSSCLA